MAPLKDVWIKSIKENKGRPRLYLDGRQAIRTGFAPGDKFEIDVAGNRLTLTKKIDGSRTVSARTRRDKEYPVIDINSAELLKIFDGMDAVRLVVGEDKVTFLPLATEVQKRERLARIKHKLYEKQPLLTGSLTHGAGILAHAIHTGLQDAGVECEMAFANEIRDDMMLQAIETNDAWSANTAALAIPQQELAADEWLMGHLPKLEVLDFSLPCSGASLAGRAQRGGGHPEEHPEIGHLVVSALMNKMEKDESGRRPGNDAIAAILAVRKMNKREIEERNRETLNGFLGYTDTPFDRRRAIEKRTARSLSMQGSC